MKSASIRSTKPGRKAQGPQQQPNGPPAQTTSRTAAVALRRSTHPDRKAGPRSLQ